MTEAWGIVYIQGFEFTAGAVSILSAHNPVGSGVVARIYRIRAYTTNQVGGTGAQTTYSLNRTISVDADGGASGPRKAELRAAPVDPRYQISPAVRWWSGREVITTGIPLRRVSFSSDDLTGNQAKDIAMARTSDLPYAELWYVDPTSEVQPLVLRAGEGFVLSNATSLTAMTVDYEVLFTTE